MRYSKLLRGKPHEPRPISEHLNRYVVRYLKFTEREKDVNIWIEKLEEQNAKWVAWCEKNKQYYNQYETEPMFVSRIDFYLNFKKILTDDQKERIKNISSAIAL